MMETTARQVPETISDHVGLEEKVGLGIESLGLDLTGRGTQQEEATSRWRTDGARPRWRGDWGRPAGGMA
jgi:hypothetical protein